MAIFDNSADYSTVVATAGTESSRVVYVQNGVGFDFEFNEVGEVDEFNNLLTDADVIKRAKSRAKSDPVKADPVAEPVNDIPATG